MNKYICALTQSLRTSTLAELPLAQLHTLPRATYVDRGGVEFVKDTKT